MADNHSASADTQRQPNSRPKIRNKHLISSDRTSPFDAPPTEIPHVTRNEVLSTGRLPDHVHLLDTAHRARVAAREAVRLKASTVSFAPTLRDQGSARIEVGEGDAAVVREWIRAYDTEKRLQAQGLTPAADVSSFVIEAGPKYFESASRKVGEAIEEAKKQLAGREAGAYIVGK
jgi:hypothetical protein